MAGRNREPETHLTFEERLAGPPLLLDGALGTEIERHGGDAGLPLWSARALLEDPELVARIHRAHVEAGAEVLVANTFRTQARTLAHAGLADRAAEWTALAVSLARAAGEDAPGPCWIAGSAPPLEDCYRPDRVPDDESLRREHASHVENLAAAGVDVVWGETWNTVREARAVLRAAREAGLPAIASFVCDGEARLLSGEPLAAAVEVASLEGAAAVGVNCMPTGSIEPCLPILADASLPFVAYANLGEPAEDGSFRSSHALDPSAFAACAKAWLEAGAWAVGGCCGTTPAHVAAIGSVVSARRGSRTQFVSPHA